MAVTVIAIVGFFGHDAFAVGFDIKDQASCQSLPSGNPIWDSTTKTCTVTAISLTLNKTDSMTVYNGITLVINGGTINNSGTITVTPNLCECNDIRGIIDSSATINNSGAINIPNFATFRNISGGIINNLSGGGFSDGDGYGLENDAGATINNYSGGSIINYFGFTNRGTVNNWGSFSGPIANGGTINNNAGGSFHITKTISSLSGTFNNLSGGTFFTDISTGLSGTINNSGNMTENYGLIVLGGTINNNAGGTITENQILTSTGTITN